MVFYPCLCSPSLRGAIATKQSIPPLAVRWISSLQLAMTAHTLSRSRSENDVLALADMPGNHKPFDPVDDPEQHDTEQRQDHQRRKHRGQIEGAERALQHVADARI